MLFCRIIYNDIILFFSDFIDPLTPVYPATQPVTIVRPQGRNAQQAQIQRHNSTFTELVLPPGYIQPQQRTTIKNIPSAVDVEI